MGTVARNSICRRPVAGISLVELMVSMLLGVLLCAGMITAYLGAKRNQFYEEQLARVQENGRYAMRLLSREIVMAGFFGARPGMSAVPAARVASDCSDHDWALDARRPLETVDNVEADAPLRSSQGTMLTCIDTGMLVAGSDVLALKRTAAEASMRWGVVAEDLTSASTANWYLRTESTGDARWELLRPLDLRRADNAVPSRSYWEAVTRIFYIRSGAEGASDYVAMPELCMETLAGNGMTTRCLVEGVENMQLEFGIDADADAVPDFYVAGPSPIQLERAVSVKVYILLRSIDKLAGHHDDSSYQLGQASVAATHDAYLRRVFTTTVYLRNRSDPIG